MLTVVETLDGRMLVTDIERGPSSGEDLRRLIACAIKDGVEIKSYEEMVEDEELEEIVQSNADYLLFGAVISVE